MNIPRSLLSVGSILIALAAARSAYAAVASAGPVKPPMTDARIPAESGTVVGRVKNAATGQYLNNARVSVGGLDASVYTDAFGHFHLVGVPPGPASLEVFYTGLDPWRATITVPAGGTLEQDVSLTSVARYGQTGAAVQLDAFVVSSDKETDARTIAVNEQRFAPNIKNVISTDAVGDVLGGSVGEFLKFIPGVTTEYAGNEVTGISIRGIGGGMTSFTNDGAPMVFASYVGPDRAFNMYTQDINDASRIEVTKVPTPSTPADSLAGSVNMISKSAFDRDQAQFRYGLGLVGNSENLTFKRTPHSYGDRNEYKVFPSASFDLTLPLKKTFGIVVTGLHAIKTGEIHQFVSTYENAGTTTGASLSRPYLRQFQLVDGPRTFTRTNLSFKADWKVTPNSVLSLGVQWNEHETKIGSLTFTPTAGNVGTPSVASGNRLTYGGDFTDGATGRGAVTMSSIFQTFGGGTGAPSLTYRFDDGIWKIDTGMSAARSYIARNNPANGHFMGLTATVTQPLRLKLSAIDHGRPGLTQAFDNSNREINLYDIANYGVAAANDAFYEREMKVESANLKVRRRLQFLPFAAAIEAGGAQRVQSFDNQASTKNWTYAGPDGNTATVDPAAPYLMQVYKNQDSYYGFRNLPWISPSRAWTAYGKNPGLFVQTRAKVVAEETSRLNGSQNIREAVSAAYVQVETSPFRGRLRILTGVRFERTTDEGEGAKYDPSAVFVRNANGSFARNAQGARIRKPEAGAAGSLTELHLLRTERGYRARRSYDGYYPSLHLTWEWQENTLVRGAYARTYGRPNFGAIIPSATFNEADLSEDQIINDPSISRGNITVTNTGLRPWTADNYDLSVEHYSKSGGLFSAGIFLKEIRDFFGTSQRLATAADAETLGLDARYIGWTVSSTFNSGDAEILGAEVNVRHSLRGLGRWGANFTVFANATKLELRGNQQASFDSFIPESANWGVSFNWKRFSTVAKWNYRGLDKRIPSINFGPDGYQYYKARTTLDLNLAYEISRRLTLAASINNVFYAPTQIYMDYGSQTPAYARQSRIYKNGIPISLTLKGTF